MSHRFGLFFKKMIQFEIPPSPQPSRDCVVSPFIVRQDLSSPSQRLSEPFVPSRASGRTVFPECPEQSRRKDSPRTDHTILKINCLAVRPEALEGETANYDTVSPPAGRGKIRRFASRYYSFPFPAPFPEIFLFFSSFL